jgi:hypothetical protein
LVPIWELQRLFYCLLFVVLLFLFVSAFSLGVGPMIAYIMKHTLQFIYLTIIYLQFRNYRLTLKICFFDRSNIMHINYSISRRSNILFIFFIIIAFFIITLFARLYFNNICENKWIYRLTLKIWFPICCANTLVIWRTKHVRLLC